MSPPEPIGWLDLQRAAVYLSLSVRTLRIYLGHHQHPLPMRRVGGKWIGKSEQLDRWAEGFPMAGQDIDRMVGDLIKEISSD